MTDPLTGILNRRGFEIRAKQIFADQATLDKGMCLLMLDIDHFKKINDTHGHIIGDEVLILVARLLEKSFRQSDLLYRFGGEEFIAIIAADNVDAATLAFERARKAIGKFQFPQVGHITLSGGFTGADPTVLPQEVISRADSSLYVAKNAGRNRIYHYDTLVREGILKEVATGSIDMF